MASTSSRRHLMGSRDTLGSLGRSCDPLYVEERETDIIKQDLDSIRIAIEALKTNLASQQYAISRDFEDRVRNVYDVVVNDVNEIRKQVNSLGDTYASKTKFKTWVPLVPFRKNVIKSKHDVKPSKSKLKGSKSVDFVELGEVRNYSDSLSRLDLDRTSRRSQVYASNTSVDSRLSCKSAVEGFGRSFHGDNKTIPFRSYRAKYHFYRNPNQSWGPSRSGSRSTLLDEKDEDDEDKGCLCGTVTDDWRVKVAPYMWEGWPLPGVEPDDVDKLRERIQKFQEIKQETVEVHNEYRRRHACPDLSVSEELSRDAQQWAEILALKGYAQYSDSQNRGENILVVDIEDNISGRQIVDTWYREGKHYNYKQAKWQRGTSNFTQLVWRASKTVGVGMAKSAYQDTYVFVAQYQPPGNLNTPGQFRKNVPVPDLRTPNHENQDCSMSIETVSHCESVKTNDCEAPGCSGDKIGDLDLAKADTDNTDSKTLQKNADDLDRKKSKITTVV